MPQIKVYQENQNPYRAVDSSAPGRIAGGQLADAGTALAKAGAQYEAFETQRQTSKLAADFATTQANLTNQWADTIRTADPNDPNTAKDFMEKVVQPALGDIQSNHEGLTADATALYTRLQSDTVAHFSTQTAAGQSELHGKAAAENFTQSLDQMSTAVANDPSSLEFQNHMTDVLLDNLVKTGGLSSEQAIEMQGKAHTTNTVSAIRGMININPEAAKKLLAEGHWDDKGIDGEQKSVLQGYADTAILAREEAARKQQEAAADDATNRTLDILATKGPSQEALATIINDKAYDTGPGAAKRRTMFDMYRAMLDAQKSGDNKPTIDNAQYSSLMSNALLPDGDPNKQPRDYFLSLVKTPGDFERVQQILKSYDRDGLPGGNDEARLLQKFLSQSEQVITGKTGFSPFPPTSQDMANNQAFINEFMSRYRDMRSKGMSPSQILDPGNKHGLYGLVDSFTPSEEQRKKYTIGMADPNADPNSLLPEGRLHPYKAPPVQSPTASINGVNVPPLTLTSNVEDVKRNIVSVADKYGVPRHIALGLVDQETGGKFNPDAKSPTGATGLAQLTQDVERRYGLKNNDSDPNKNLDAGLHYLSDLKQQWGTWELALKHYGDANQLTYSAEVMTRAAKYAATAPALAPTETPAEHKVRLLKTMGMQ